jgi:hypothetical protein
MSKHIISKKSSKSLHNTNLITTNRTSTFERTKGVRLHFALKIEDYYSIKNQVVLPIVKPVIPN